MNTKSSFLAGMLVSTGIVAAAQISDPAWDTSGPDLVRFDYQVVNQALDLTLTFAEELEGSVIDPVVQASILVDIDRSNLTGFRPGPGLHTRFGADYEIEVFLGGFGPTSNSGELRYWRRRVSSVPPFTELERVQVALGDWFDPNGSVFVVGADWTYGTDSHQVYVHVPLDLFSNVQFPICGEGALCINDVFPCPLAPTSNMRTAFLSVLAMDPYDLNGTADVLPDAGMIDCANSSIAAPFPSDATDLVASATDPDNDGVAQPGINGEELIGLKAFRHAGNNLAFELKLLSYSLEDTAIYGVALDLDDNPASGEQWVNGSTTLGVDLVAEFANFDNPIGWANPLQGTIYFRQAGQWCPLNYADYLATVWRSAPGYVYITLPAEHVARLLAANLSRQVKALALTMEPDPITFFNDVVPNQGALVVPLGPAPVLTITAIARQPDRSFRLRFSWTGSASAVMSVRTSVAPTGPWLPEPSAVVTSLGGGEYEAKITPNSGVPTALWRVVATTSNIESP
jgi:hypothetical protein